MATCPHCGDAGAPTRGWCLVCGQRVDAAGAVAAAPPASAPALAPAPAPPPAPVAPSVVPSVAPSLDLEFDEPTTRVTAVPRSGAVPPPAPVVMPAALGVPVPRLAPLSETVSPDASTDVVFPHPGPTTLPAAERAVREATQPHAAISLRARYELSSVPGDDPPLLGVLLEITASGKPLREDVAGPVAHVVLALDVSASMNTADKFPVLRAALEQMLGDLRAPDAAPVLLSVVIFGRGAAVVVRDAVASRVAPERLLAAIHGHPLCFSNYTDVAGALDRAGRIAYEQARRARTLPVRIYLLTDGRPQDMARARAAAARVGRVPCDLHALAFGRDADVRALQELFAGRRGGTVKSVRRETLSDAFERIAEVAQRVVATRCDVAVELAPGVVGGAAFRYRPARVRFPDPAFADKRLRADLGTVETDRTYSLLFEVRPQETDSPTSVLGNVTVRIPSYGGPVVSGLRLVLPRTPRGAARPEEDREVRAARDILDALDDTDPLAALRALRLRRRLYEQERRDPGLLAILDHAIDLLERTGSLAGLSAGEHATLLAHTCTSGADTSRERGNGAPPRPRGPGGGR